MQFLDRHDAGRRLGALLEPWAEQQPVVIGLPRGGVVVAAEVAAALNAPLDVIVVRKLGVPYQPELAMGAIGEGGVRLLERQIVARLRLTEEQIAPVEARERAELERRLRSLRADRVAIELTGRTVLVVDDGIATGSTARAACRVARARGAGRVVLAVPVAPDGVAARMRPDADDVVCLYEPLDFGGVGRFYRDFSQTSDEEVTALLHGGAPP
jgi:putative phosphoribosyl transferase